jgi:hypothetical protein
MLPSSDPGGVAYVSRGVASKPQRDTFYRKLNEMDDAPGSEQTFLRNTIVETPLSETPLSETRSVGDMVREFNVTFGHPVRDTPQVIDSAESGEVMSWAFFGGVEGDWSELEELTAALEENDLVQIADACGDIVWLVYVLAQRHGIDLDAVLREIYKSNMSKLGPDGKPVFYPGTNKIGKGPFYRPPTDGIAEVLGLVVPADEDEEESA